MKNRFDSMGAAAIVAGALVTAFGFVASAEPNADIKTQAKKAAAPAAATAPKPPPYQVMCTDEGCKVDKQTFKGWRTFHGFCAACHAQDAVGSTFAPSLLDRTKEMSKERFEEVLTNGYTGQVGVMPAWKDNPNVMPKKDALWSFLRARADGVLRPGRPGKL